MGLSATSPISASRAAFLGFIALVPALLGGLPAPAQGVGMPTLRAGQEALALEALDIRVQVVGTLATTTWDLTFRNPQDRVLEGELVFPLGEGQAVSRFALPVNGALRESVVVPKAKGQEAFEAVVRRPNRVDPGLLEKTEGNAFRTRIYPIPARGTYRVVIAYEQELGSRGRGGLTYRLPLDFKERVGAFSLHLEVEEQAASPRVRTSLEGLAFRQAGRSWRSDFQGSNLRLDRPLELVIPRAEGQQATFIHREGEVHRFYAQLDLPARREAKVHPRSILVVWDASASAAQRDLRRERALLGAYLKGLGEVKVDVVVLRNEAEAPVPFLIRAGRVEALLRFLENAPLDGGTRMDALHLGSHAADEVLLFSDGMANLGSGIPELPQVPLTAVNSAVNGRHAWMRGLAEGLGGEYLNLQELKDVSALENLRTRPLAFLGFSGAPGDVHEVYPAKGEVIRGTFGLAGVQIGEKARLTLKFGYGSQVAFTREVVLDAGAATSQPLATRIWAQKKLAALLAEPERNREEILRLGQAHGLVTDETSLIVLETVEDYARFRIPPPADLRAAYDQLVAREDQGKAAEREILLNGLASRLEEEKRWWAMAFDPPKTEEKVASPSAPAPMAPPPAPAPAPAPTPAPAPSTASLPVSSATGAVGGRVQGPNWAPMAGVEVRLESAVVSGGARTAVTDAEGRYSLRHLPPGDYQVTARKQGCTAIQSRLSVVAHQTMAVNFQLRAEAMAVVEVVAASAAIDQTSTRSGTVYSVEGLDSIPQARNQASMAALSPGVSGAGADIRVAPAAPTPNGRVEIAAWSADAPYLRALREAQPHERYEAYLKQRKAYGAAPGFYMDVCDFFEEHKDRTTALRVLSNLAELNLDHPGLLRVLAHRLQQLGEHGLAIQTFERVLKLRPEEPQSLRDLGLAHGRAGHFQKAADTLYQVLLGRWDGRFLDVDLIALNELNALLATHPVETGAFDRRILAILPVDLRVVLTWDTNDSDMDLHVTDPRGERCMFSHTRTAIGGRISRDITQGYGPEEFMLRRAIPGTYRIEANYYGTRQQTAVVGPTTLKAELFLHFGAPQEVRREILLKLDGRGQTLAVGSFLVE